MGKKKKRFTSHLQSTRVVLEPECWWGHFGGAGLGRAGAWVESLEGAGALFGRAGIPPLVAPLGPASGWLLELQQRVLLLYWRTERATDRVQHSAFS